MNGEVVTVDTDTATRGLFGLDNKQVIDIAWTVSRTVLDVAQGQAVEVEIPVTVLGKRIAVTVRAVDA